MKISYNWLTDYIKTDLTLDKISSILTDIGLEVEGVEEIESIKGILEGIIVGEVLECEKHPNADKLKITKVNLGKEQVQIVCGAPNVATGQKVPVATIGTILYTSEGEKFEIKKSKIRGEESWGMICAEDELGLGNNHEGIIILDPSLKPGTPLSEVYQISKDFCIEIGLTPNRTDAMSHYGVARDLYAALKSRKIKATLHPVSTEKFTMDETSGSPITVTIEEPKLCPRYSAIYLKNIEITPSPEWLQNYLKTIGLTPINNVVDITNYILHAYGQPLHAFDADKIEKNKIKVGTVASGSTITTLDGITRTLDGTELIIKDGKENPLCLAGIYGGKDSGVTENTKNIFLESAYFNSVSIRKTSKKEGLNTDASFRYERGTDINNTVFALKKACELLKEYANATIIGEIIDAYPTPVKNTNCILRYHKIDQILGKRIHRDQIKKILESLEFTIISETNDVLDLIVPAYRVDVTREIDVIEEIARIYGYNNIELPQKFSFSYEKKEFSYEEIYDNLIANQLKYNGFHEVMNNSLTQKREDSANYVEIINPLSAELAIMRQSLVYGLLENVTFNVNRNQKEIKLFEFGKTYFKIKETYVESKKLGLVLHGAYQEISWASSNNKSTFYHIKGIISQILNNFKIPLQQVNELPVSSDEFKEGIELQIGKNIIGKLGIVNSKILKEAKIKGEVFYAELEWEKLIQAKTGSQNEKLQKISKFPGSERDLALLLDNSIKYIDLYKTAFETEKKLLKSVSLFDVYEGKNLPEGKKSYALNFYLQDDEKTLTDKEIDKVMSKLLEKFISQYNAELRN